MSTLILSLLNTADLVEMEDVITFHYGNGNVIELGIPYSYTAMVRLSPTVAPQTGIRKLY